MWRRTLTMVRHAGRPDEGRGSLAGQATHIEAWRPATSVKLPPHMCATTPSSFVVVRVRTELAFRRRWHSGALRMIAEHALSARRRPFAPAGWAALAAYQPPELGVRFPVAGWRRGRLLGAPVAAKQLIQQLAPTGRCAPPAARAAHQDLPMPLPHTAPFAPPSSTAPLLSDRSLRALPGPDGRSRLHSACRDPLTGPLFGCACAALATAPVPATPISAPSEGGVATAATAVAEPLAAAQALVPRPARPPPPCVAPLSPPSTLPRFRSPPSRRRATPAWRTQGATAGAPHDFFRRPSEGRTRRSADRGLCTPRTPLTRIAPPLAQAASHPPPQRRCR